MCVIVGMIDSYPDEKDWEQMWDQNDHGAGVAWVDKGRVFWQKGIMEYDHFMRVVTFLQKKKFIEQAPVVAHMRIASCGGVRQDLTHPFPLTPAVPLTLTGSNTEGVLFHNGHVTGWQKHLIAAGLANGMKLPDGAWSDSRMLAYYVAKLGDMVIDGLDGVGIDRVATLTPQWGLLKWGSWIEKKNRGWVASNDNYERRSYGKKNDYCSVGGIKSLPEVSSAGSGSRGDAVRQDDGRGLGQVAGSAQYSGLNPKREEINSHVDNVFRKEEVISSGRYIALTDGSVQEVLMELRDWKRRLKAMKEAGTGGFGTEGLATV